MRRTLNKNPNIKPNGILLSGLSGSGKSTALRALEDLGYQVIDNLPVPLLQNFFKILDTPPWSGPWVLGLDMRNLKLVQNFPKLLKEAQKSLKKTKIIFLEANTPTLLQRYAETRRQHPLAQKHKSLEECVEEERFKLSPIKASSHHRLDTSGFNVHELKKQIRKIILGAAKEPPLSLRLFSFAYKRGLPLEADLILDTRFLKNPYFETKLKNKNGLQKTVQDFVLRQKAAQTFLKQVKNLLNFLIPFYLEQGKSSLSLGLGCTGGQHRSVTLVEKLAKEKFKTVEIQKFHRDLK